MHQTHSVGGRLSWEGMVMAAFLSAWPVATAGYVSSMAAWSPPRHSVSAIRSDVAAPLEDAPTSALGRSLLLPNPEQLQLARAPTGEVRSLLSVSLRWAMDRCANVDDGLLAFVSPETYSLLRRWQRAHFGARSSLVATVEAARRELLRLHRLHVPDSLHGDGCHLVADRRFPHHRQLRFP